MFSRKEKEKELMNYHADFLKTLDTENYSFVVKTGFFQKGKFGRQVQLFEAELSKGVDIFIELVDFVRNASGEEVDMVSMFEDRPLFKYRYNPYFSEEYDVKVGTNSRGEEYSAYVVPISELVCVTASGEEISYNVYEKRKAEAPKEQIKVSSFPDFEQEFIPKLKQKVEGTDETTSDILLRISLDFQKLAQKLK
jgi:hypothetical protein